MSLTVMAFQTCEVGEFNDEIAVINDAGTITIYPKGVAIGPSISMSIDDWIRIMNRTTAVVQKWIDAKIAEVGVE